jgi:hypothetical protein
MYKKIQTLGLIFILLVIANHPLLAQKGIYLYPSMDSLTFQDIEEVVAGISLFDNPDVLDISIRADFKELIKNKFDDTYRDAEFSYMLNDTILVSDELKIKPRGNFRKRLCYLPPVKLNFKKNEYLIAQSKELDKLKMVTVCRQSKANQQYIFKEYLVYKMYNILTEYSLRTRLLKLQYIDTSGKLKPDSTYAFLIEPVDLLAERMNCIEIEGKVGHQELTDYDHMNFVATFQFMIGNLDWSVPVKHNIKLLKSTSTNLPRPIVVPYDFDFCGFVNTSYAHPPEQLDVLTVRDRLFRGFCRTPEQYEAAFNIFREKKDEIFNLIETNPFLTKSTRTDVSKFIKEFYDIIDSEYQVKRYFIEGCRKQ